MERFALVLILLIVVTNAFLLENVHDVYLFVSSHGSDSNTGRDVGHPLKTLDKAVSHLKDKDLQGKNIIIELMAGYYDLHSTLRITNTDPRRHVTIRPYQDQQVHVTGGKRIDSKYFHPVTDQTAIQRLPNIAKHKVYQVKLRDAGITNLGVLSEYGFYKKRTAALEIFENGQPLKLAQYPNEGYINIASVQPNSTTSFTYSSDRPRQWHGENDIWAHGFWYYSWADRAIKVQHIDPQRRTINLTKPTAFGLRKGHYSTSNPSSAGYSKQGGYFKFVNVMSELDEPGEYYVDRDTGILYIWPSSSQAYKTGDIMYASMLNDCLQVSHNSGNIVIEGFVLEACRRYGILGDTTHNITVTRMQVKNTGSYGIKFQNRGSNIKVSQCDVRQTDGGIAISGGDRKTLIPSGHEVSDNIVSHFGRVAFVGTDGISSSGVGNHIHHNTLWKGSYTGIHWNGNDHVFEYNHISEMCLNASDCGGMMTGRDWTYRGNIIRYNHIHDTKRRVPGADVRGIMLDDQYSSVLIEKNVFHDNDVHVNIGGGRDNIVRQNVFYNTLQYSMQVDSRGLHRGDYHDDIMRKLENMPYTGTLWAQRYPKLATIKSNTPYLPVGNLITQNIFYAVQKENIHYLNQQRDDWYNVTDNAYENNEHSFYAPSYGNFKPLCSLQEFASRTKFPDPILPANVGVRYPVGPKHIQTEQPVLGYKSGHTPSPRPCTTHAPSVAPTRPYLPDGSGPNTLHNVSRVGCWFLFDKCPNHPELQKDHRSTSNQYYRDINGEKQDHSGTSESACLGKVSSMVSKCGRHSSFVVIYGPTGAMTLGGEGCYFAQYTCPKHGITRVGFVRDAWAEKTQNAAIDENACLSRVLSQWTYCGSTSISPLVSIYRPTGHTRVAGYGCWIKLQKCVKDNTLNAMFYDSWGASNIGTGHTRVAGYGCWIKPEKCVKDNTLNAMFYDSWGASNIGTDNAEESCFQRAEYFWRLCGSHAQFKVTAYFRPKAKSFTYP